MKGKRMTDQKHEHIDAIASAIDSAERMGDALVFTEWSKARGIAAARRILDSQNPAVHAAMLDALTRHGVLTVHAWGPVFGGGYSKHYRTASEPITSDEALALLRERLTGEAQQ